MKPADSIATVFAVLSLFCCIACNCTGRVERPEPDAGGPEVPPEVRKDVTVFLTKADGSALFVRSGLAFGKPGSMSPDRVEYDTASLSSEVDGFGFALTTASCFNLLKMKAEDRRAFLEELFSVEKGVGSSLIRVSIGASDFCISEEYTWCDEEGLSHFGVPPEDRDLLFPVLKEIYAVNPGVKIIASPWSCPKWMKGRHSDGNDPQVMEEPYPSWTSGRLRPSCREAYAEYFVRWIKAMEAEGFDIYAVTMQNEPLNHGNSMSLYMPWQDQKAFIKVLGPALEKAGLGKVKILLFDHNYNYDGRKDQQGYPLHIFHDAEASRWAAGSAWHNYGGDVRELSNIVREYPDKEIYFTEASIGTWNYDRGGRVGANFGSCLLDDMESIFFGILRYGGRGVTCWNLMLDDRRGPHSIHPGACTTCYGGVTLSASDYRTVTRNSQWYDVAHASAVIRSGARRIAASGMEEDGGLSYLMYLNPDRTVGTLILNRGDKARPMVFVNDRFSVRYTAPARSIVSLLWQDDAAPRTD